LPDRPAARQGAASGPTQRKRLIIRAAPAPRLDQARLSGETMGKRIAKSAPNLGETIG
jgi:hypothetical protein